MNSLHNEYYLECFLRDPLGVYSQSTTLFVPEKHFKLRDPKISAQIVVSDRRFSITLSAEAFARAVEISFTDVDAVFYDNYVDLTGSAPMKIAFTITSSMSTAEQLMASLKIKSIYDVKK
jgi:beta-mannosidase